MKHNKNIATFISVIGVLSIPFIAALSLVRIIGGYWPFFQQDPAVASHQNDWSLCKEHGGAALILDTCIASTSVIELSN